jgi:hypothetical protein
MSADALPLDWVVETDPRRGEDRQYCPTCSREHLRSIEGKLDTEYW